GAGAEEDGGGARGGGDRFPARGVPDGVRALFYARVFVSGDRRDRGLPGRNRPIAAAPGAQDAAARAVARGPGARHSGSAQRGSEIAWPASTDTPARKRSSASMIT